MFIKPDGTRINIYSRFTSANGTRYASLENADVRAQLGITEIPDPVPPEDFSDDTYYRTEQDDAPYVVWTKKSPEQLKQVRNAKRKAHIARIEDKQSMRAIREALLTGDKTKLQDIEDQVTTVRGQLEVEDEPLA